jgi:hypothetical protein
VHFTKAFGLAAVTVLLCLAGTGRAWADLFGDQGGEPISLEEPGSAPTDFALLRDSHLTELATWPGVQPLKPGPDDAQTYAWAAVEEPGYNHLKSLVSRQRLTVRPLRAEPLTTTIGVPTAGSYRVWLCYLAVPGVAQPVTLTLGEVRHVYGSKPLITGEPLSSQEERLPLRCESEMERIAPPRAPLLVWEYADLTLPAGPLPVSVQAAPGKLRVDSLFLTRSKSFTPSRAMVHDQNTLGRTYLRARVTKGPADAAVTFTDDMTYHAFHTVHGDPAEYWYWSLERQVGGKGTWAGPEDKPVKPGEWSRWLDLSGTIVNGGGYATTMITANGVPPGTPLEVQLAWYPHEGGVLRTLAVPVGAQTRRGMFLLPVYPKRPPLPEPDPAHPEAPLWGVRDPAWLAKLRNTLDVAAEHQAAVDKLALPASALPSRIRFTTSCAVDPAAGTAAVAMLRTMGFSHCGYGDKQVLAQAGMQPVMFTHHNDILFHSDTHCPSDPMIEATLRSHFAGVVKRAQAGGFTAADVVLAKLGDEIGAICSVRHMNECTDCRAAFHRYLAEHYGEPAFFGVSDLASLRVQPELSPAQGRYERRLYYASQRFVFDFTAAYYARVTKTLREVLPNCQTYCNFSPHPVIFGGTMNHSDWFNLTRRGGTTYAWGEDWASMSSWGMWMGLQIVSYYAAMVEAAARGTGQKGGFYAVGGGAQQQFACLAHGLETIVLYSYGPEYALADAANAWSQRFSVYPSIARGLHAAGPADALIADGQREPASVALLYNRDHEIWHESGARLWQSDRVATFMGLAHANLPVAIVIAEDLLAGERLPYRAVYLNGFNLGAEEVAALTRYAEAGGTVVATAGAGLYDRFDEANPAAAALLGVDLALAGQSVGGNMPDELEKHAPLDELTVPAGPLGPATTLPVIGQRLRLTVRTNAGVEILGTFGDGSPGLVRRPLGKGWVYTYGLMPGASYRSRTTRNVGEGQGYYNTYRAADRALLAGPALLAAGERAHRYAEPLVETRRFDGPDATAITFNNFTYRPLPPTELRVRWPAARPLASVHAALAGPLTFTRDGDWVVTALPLPDEVDTVILRERPTP